MPITLEVDNRERDLIDILTNLFKQYNDTYATKKDFEPVAFEVKALDLGDAILRRSDTTCAYIYERKTLADLAASIVDGRHKSQGLRMVSAGSVDGTRLRLICEIPKAKREFMSVFCTTTPYPGTRISAAALRGAVENGEMRDSIIPCWTENKADTALFLLGKLVYARKFEDSLAAPATTAASISAAPEPTPMDNLAVVAHHRKKKSDNCTAQTCFADMLNAMTGVGMKRAVDIAEYFGSMKNLVDRLTGVSTKKQLVETFKEVSGVGATTAENVYEGIFGSKLQTT